MTFVAAPPSSVVFCFSNSTWMIQACDTCYNVICVCVCVCWTFTSLCLTTLRHRTTFYLGTLFISVCVYMCVWFHACTGVCMCVCVLFCWCRWVYTCNYASWCTSYAYVYMLTTFRDTFLVKLRECRIWIWTWTNLYPSFGNENHSPLHPKAGNRNALLVTLSTTFPQSQITDHLVKVCPSCCCCCSLLYSFL